MRKIISVIIILAALYGGYRFFGAGQAAMPGMGAMPPAKVSVATVISRDVAEWDEFSGRLEAIDRVEIRPRVAGSIDAIHFTEGQFVTKGDVLFTIDPKPYEAALLSAKAVMNLAQTEFARAEKLFPEKAISQREFDERKNALAVAKANLTKAELDLGYTRIKAPVAGRIGRAEITQGNLVGAGGESPMLTTIVSLNPIYAAFEVDEQSYVRYLRAHGDNQENLSTIPVELGLSGEEGFPYLGHVQSFDNELNTRAGSVRVRAVIDNKEGALIPGLFARIRINGNGRKPAILVRESAIGTDQNKKIVYVVGSDNKAEFREVTLGPVAEGLRIIRSGLKPGENIIAVGIQRVQPGATIEPEMVDMDPHATETPAP